MGRTEKACGFAPMQHRRFDAAIVAENERQLRILDFAGEQHMPAMMQAAVVAGHIGRIAGRVILRDAHGLLAVMIRAKIRRLHCASEG